MERTDALQDADAGRSQTHSAPALRFTHRFQLDLDEGETLGTDAACDGEDGVLDASNIQTSQLSARQAWQTTSDVEVFGHP